MAGCDKCDKSGQRSTAPRQHVTNVTNAVTGGQATGPLMGHMNTLMGGIVMTACNTGFVTEDIGAMLPTDQNIILLPLLITFSHLFR